MLEIIKEAGIILKDLPDLAIYILIGILFYKTVIVGSIFGIAKLIIERAHNVMTKPKEVVVKYDFDDVIYKHTGGLKKFKDFIRGIVDFKGGYSLCVDEIDFIIDAYNEKIERDGITKSYELKRKNRKD